MTTTPPAKPLQNELTDATERFHNDLLLILGLALIGAATIALGFAGRSPAGVAVGAGIVLAAGGISIFNAIARSRFFLDKAAVREVDARAAIDEARHATTSMPPRPLRNGSSPNNGTSRERSSELFDPGISRDRLFRPN
jgi:hypothetical protein